MMLVPEFAVEVFGFLDRIHVGSSLLANRRMHDCLNDARGILPVHPLSCELRRENLVRDVFPLIDTPRRSLKEAPSKRDFKITSLITRGSEAGVRGAHLLSKIRRF